MDASGNRVRVNRQEISISGRLIVNIMSYFPHILLVDMNSFFASVEQQANPRYRNKPLGVCASLHPTSCLIAASKEAKKRGIKTGTLIWKAKKICPDIILTLSDPEKYREVNRRFNKVLADYSDRIEHYSIDESFVDLTDSKKNPLQVGVEIKQRIKKEAGEAITCSVGIAENKFLAKLAADMMKPDGLTVIWREHLREIYKHKKLSDLWGVARGWTKRLARLGIATPNEVMDYPVANLMAAYGKPGYYLWERINGFEVDRISYDGQEDPVKSFGHSWVLNFRSTDRARLAPVIMRLGEKAARRMRKDGYRASGIYLSIAMADGNRYSQSKRLDFTISTGQEFYDLAMQMWKNWRFYDNVSHIAIGFTGLTSENEQKPLFGQDQINLSKSLDIINDKYGEFTIRSGLLTHSSDYAPDAIAFGK